MLKKFINTSNNVERDSFIWNMVATISNSMQTMILMLVLTRMGQIVQASYLAIGYTIANLACMVGKYGIRNYQVSDVQERYSYATYIRNRVITIVLMSIFFVVYTIYGIVFNQYTVEKTFCVLFICFFKMVEAIEDVFHGRLQQKKRLDIGMKILGIRNVIYVLEFVITYMCTQNLYVTLIICLITTLISSFVLNKCVEDRFWIKAQTQKEKVDALRLLIEGFPVAFSAFMVMYIGNSPKYIVDSIVSDQEQTYFNILFLVIFTISLLSNFIYNPILRKLSEMWEKKDISRIINVSVKVLLYIVSIMLLAVIVAELFGRKLLGMIYGVSLEAYRLELLVLIIAGGMISLLNYMNLILIMMRKQVYFMICCGISCLIMICRGHYALVTYNLMGLIVLYVIALALGNIMLMIGAVKSLISNKGMKK